MISNFMAIAIEEAQQAALCGEIPVGAVIVNNNKVVAKAHNLMRQQQNPTAHAEILAIQKACHILQTERLIDCDLYVTLEPCTMCAAAISFARIRRLYFSAEDLKGGGVYHGAQFYSQPTCHHKPEIYSGFSGAQTRRLLQEFFKNKRV